MRRRPTELTLGLRRSALAAVALVALLVPGVAGAAEKASAFVPASLRSTAEAQPERSFTVLVQSAPAEKGQEPAQKALAALQSLDGAPVGLLRKFSSVNGVQVSLTGRQLLKLALKNDIVSITPDFELRRAGYSNRQQWPYVTGVQKLWSESTAALPLTAPAIAVVDSGIEASRADFGGRVLAEVSLYSGTGRNSAGDGRGHGTFVASIAAGQVQGYTGMAPNAPIVSLDVVDDFGNGKASDLLAACDWLLANASRYGIRVANFSIYAQSPASIRFDPINRAVEKLWLSGVVVVTASGNYGSATAASGVPYAPANDPFVITVGAADIEGNVSTINDSEAWWSAWGYTPDGFLKPDLSAPGRYMVGAVPAGSTFASEHPERIVAPGYMQISGTSFAAPVVAGAAAYLLAKHPTWTPDQVKGALLLRAKPMPDGLPGSFGVGELNVAASAQLTLPPNPNLSLYDYVVPDPAGGRMFDAAAWSAAAAADPLWDAGTWEPGTWEPGTWEPGATWDTSSWASGTWEPGTWEPGTWEPSHWVSGTWEPGTWEPGTWEPVTWVTGDPTNGDFYGGGGYWISDAELQAALADVGLVSL